MLPASVLQGTAARATPAATKAHIGVHARLPPATAGATLNLLLVLLLVAVAASLVVAAVACCKQPQNPEEAQVKGRVMAEA
jgi:hypothetical protein